MKRMRMAFTLGEVLSYVFIIGMFTYHQVLLE